MKKDHAAILAALTVPCRFCGSGSGQPCFTRTMKNSKGYPVLTLDSKPTTPHAERVRAVKKLKGI